MVTFTDPDLIANRSVGYSVGVRASRRNFASRPLFAVVPEQAEGLGALVAKAYADLKKAVGSPWHIVILVVVALILLLLLFLVLKLGIKLVKAIGKKILKKGGGAVKKGGGALKKGVKPPSMAGRFPK